MSEFDDPFLTIIRSFEAFLLQQPQADLSAFLAQCRAKPERECLVELLKVDLEFAWKRNTPRKILTTVSSWFPDLQFSETEILDLLAEEFQVRHRWGNRPEISEFLATHADRIPTEKLRTSLEEIQAELLHEQYNWSPTVFSGGDDFSHLVSAPLPFADFLLEQHIGTGGIGKVYRAFQHSLQRRVAVKFLRKQFLQSPALVGSFLSEARTLAQFRHPNIIGIHGIGITETAGYFLVMDWIDGPNLKQRLREDSPNIQAVIRWAKMIAEALHHAHQRGVIHCDLKPENLLIDSERLVVSDFGFSQQVSQRELPDQSSTTITGGTPGYMAPEQIERERGVIDQRTDVYGFGVLLYFILEGTLPYPGSTPADIFMQVLLATEPPGISMKESNKENRLREIALRCLHPVQSERLPDTQSVLNLLGKIGEQQ